MTIMSLVPSVPKDDIAKDARSFADAVEAGEHGRVDAAIVIASGEQLECLYWGTSLDLVEAIGILEVAKAHLIERLMS